MSYINFCDDTYRLNSETKVTNVDTKQNIFNESAETKQREETDAWRLLEE